VSYAEDTKVPVHQSIAEIEAMVARNKHSGFQFADAGDAIAILFSGPDRRVRFTLRFATRPAASATAAERARWDKLRRSRCRALALVIKAKFVSVESEVETFEEAFLAETVMPDGRTVIEHAGPLVIAAYRDGRSAPPLLPDYSGGKK
jgi:hypothetical protein